MNRRHKRLIHWLDQMSSVDGPPQAVNLLNQVVTYVVDQVDILTRLSGQGARSPTGPTHQEKRGILTSPTLMKTSK
jgi:hypothetical protein